MGFFANIRNRWGGGAEEPKSEATTPRSPRTNVWQEVFDPNTNQAMPKGRSIFDTVDKNKKEPTCWEYVQQSQETGAKAVKEKAFEAMGAGSKEGTIDAADLRKLFAPEHVETIMQMADKNKDGKIDFNEFVDLLRKY